MSQGEVNLAAAVLTSLTEDLEAYEKTCDKKWRKKDDPRRLSILRNASDAVYCAFSKNDTLIHWLALADIPLKTFRGYLLKTYPRACALGVAG